MRGYLSILHMTFERVMFRVSSMALDSKSPAIARNRAATLYDLCFRNFIQSARAAIAIVNIVNPAQLRRY